MACLVVDRFTRSNATTGVADGVPGQIIKARPLSLKATPVFVGAIEEQLDLERRATTAADGTYIMALPRPSESLDPANSVWEISYPNGRCWKGVIPDIAGPVDIKTLRASYGWVLCVTQTPATLLGYEQVYDDGSAITQRKVFDLLGGIIAVDNLSTGRTELYLGDRTVSQGSIVANTLTKVSAAADGRHAQFGTGDDAWMVTGVALEAGVDGQKFKHGCVDGQVYQIKTDGTAVNRGDLVVPSISSAGRIRPLVGPGFFIGFAEQAASAVADTLIKFRYIGCRQR